MDLTRPLGPQDGVELRAGKAVGIVAQGTCRSLTVYSCERGDQGVYVCDAGDAQTSASLKVQGESQAGGQDRFSSPCALMLHWTPLPAA